MNQFDACPLIENMQALATNHLYMVVVGQKGGEERIANAKQSSIKIAERAKAICVQIGLTDSASKIDTSLSWLNGSVLGIEAMGTELRNIADSIIFEARKHRFLRVLPEYSTYIDHPRLFGQSVTSAFPNAAEDIREAGNCLAADCNTASVFHLMRVAEHGLRALAKDRRVKVPKGPIELATWEDIIKQIESAESAIQGYPKTLAREAQFDFYHGANMEFKRFKNKFRNAIMHTRDSYDRDEARSAFTHVKAFMQILATKISEGEMTPVIWKRP